MLMFHQQHVSLPPSFGKSFQEAGHLCIALQGNKHPSCPLIRGRGGKSALFMKNCAYFDNVTYKIAIAKNVRGRKKFPMDVHPDPYFSSRFAFLQSRVPWLSCSPPCPTNAPAFLALSASTILAFTDSDWQGNISGQCTGLTGGKTAGRKIRKTRRVG